MSAEQDKIRFAQERHLGSNYIPRKGKSREKHVDAMVSNIGNIFDQGAEVKRPSTSHYRNASNWNQELQGLAKTPAPIPELVRKNK